jgi:hypothetical protein
VYKGIVQHQTGLDEIGTTANVLYLRGTLDESLILGADDITIMKTWVDASYAVHKDFKSHTGGAVLFGRGAVMCKSAKQKLNTKSSTEAKLVGTSDYLPYPVWGKKFLEGQGYFLKENVFYQDNKSTIQFEKMGENCVGPTHGTTISGIFGSRTDSTLKTSR